MGTSWGVIICSLLYSDLMESHNAAGTLTPDDSDTDRKEKMTAIRTKTGELKFVSGGEDSEDDILNGARE